ncbi:MAG TPA: hypothetical protein VK912_04655 [Longimicrobiales bacterium]|nr:hypothetical protein [Longimicrobiales bacterium]
MSPRREALPRMFWAVVVGLFLGALFTKIAVLFMPDSAAREFLTTALSASLGPLSIDLIAVAFVIGPLTLSLNALSLVGILLVGLVMRSWF